MKWYVDGVIIRSVGVDLTERGAEFLLKAGRARHGKRLAEVIITRRQREDGTEGLETEYVTRRGLFTRIKEKVRSCKCFTAKTN